MSDDQSPGFDIGSLISQLGQVQQNLQQAQASAATQVVEGSAGGGAVKVKVTGGLEFQEITIDPSVIDPNDVDMLQDLVLAAVRDGMDKVSQLAQGVIGSSALGSIPGLGGLLGQ